MADIKDIISNIEQIYGSTSTLGILKDFERVLEELDLYVFDNWLDGELVAGPKDSKYFVECTFMWPQGQMPEPKGGLKLQEYGCKVQFAESIVTKVRKIRKPDDIRPGTKKGKIDVEPVWFVKIRMPKKLITDIGNGYNNIELEKMGQSAEQQLALNSVELADQQAQEIGNEEQIA